MGPASLCLVLAPAKIQFRKHPVNPEIPAAQAERAQWASYSMAAQALAIQQLEQARSGVWEPNGSRNKLTNLNLLSRTYNPSPRPNHLRLTPYRTNWEKRVSGNDGGRSNNFTGNTGSSFGPGLRRAAGIPAWHIFNPNPIQLMPLRFQQLCPRPGTGIFLAQSPASQRQS